MFIINNTMLKFDNIKEIKFTHVRNNVFSISIKSDIKSASKCSECIKNKTFESQLCKIDSELELKVQDEFVNVNIGNENIILSKCFSIPMNIKLLNDKQLNKIFTIE